MTTTRVFLASTLADAALQQKLSKVELPDGVEVAFAAVNEQDGGPRSVRQVSLRTLENCQAFLGIFGQKYGPAQALELRRAEERAIPRAILISEDALDKPLARLVTKMQSSGLLVRKMRAGEDLGQVAEDLLMALSSKALAAVPAPVVAVPVAVAQPAPTLVAMISTPVVVEPAPEANPFMTSPNMPNFDVGAMLTAPVEAPVVSATLPSPLVQAASAPVLAAPPVAKEVAAVVAAPVVAAAPAVAEPQISVPQMPGRTRVLQDLAKALKPKARVLLRGADGFGKSVVAKAMSQAVAARFPDGVFWLEVGERGLVSVENRLAQEIGEEIGTEHNRAARQEILKSWLGQKKVLLVLDDGGDKELWPLLGLFPEGSILITARELPRAFATESLQVIDVPALTADEGEEVVRALWPEVEAQEARDLNKAAGGAPLALAIAIADAKAQKLGPRQTAAALQAEKGDSRVEAAARRALSHLSERHQKIFAAAGVLPSSSFMVGAVASAADMDIEPVPPVLKELSDRGLLISLPQGRYQMPGALRALAAGMPHAQGAAERFAHFYRDFANTHREVGRPHLDVMEHERLGIMLSARAMSAKLAALPPKKKGGFFSGLFGRKQERDARQETAEMLIELASAASNFLNVRGYWEDWKELCNLGLEGAREINDQRREANLLVELGSLLRLELNLKDARTQLTEAINKAEAIGDKPLKAQAQHSLALITWEEKKPKEALDLLNQAIQNTDPATSRTWQRLKGELENAVGK